MNTQTSDIGLATTGDGTDFFLNGNDLAFSELLPQSIFVAMFGGNVSAVTRGDEQSSETRNDYWGNSLFKSDKPLEQFDSITERTLRNTALNSKGRQDIIAAMKEDLRFLSPIANYEVDVIILSSYRIRLDVKLISLSDSSNKLYQLIWDNTRNQIITNNEI